MARITLVTGGCRSGKSVYAQAQAESLPAPRLYVATCPLTDDEEMCRRIAAHQQSRVNRGWETVEEQAALAAVLRGWPQHRVVLVDCVTLWVNNLMYHAQQRGDEVTEAEVAAQCGELLAAATERAGAVFFVTNEVGLGVVPDNSLARRYRDLVGRANQVLAARADTVTLLCCGIPWHLKETRTS
jgi:adenosylcobinamide kinase/adenosylcobinamide-phosphate guanylyltransferase